MKLVSGAGHSPNCDGATGCGYSENHEAQRLSDSFRQACTNRGIECDDCSSDAGSSRVYLREQVSKANASGADLALQWHFNAGGGSGSSVIYYEGSDEGHNYATRISSALATIMGIPDRGAVDTCQYGSSRNLAFLNGTSMAALIIETCFIDSEDDMSAWAAVSNEDIVRAVLSAILGEPVSSPVPADDGRRSVQLYMPNRTDAQIWHFEGSADDCVLRNQACGKLLTLRTDTAHDGMYPVCVSADGDMEQHWQIVHMAEGPDDAVRILHVGDPSIMLDVVDGVGTSGAGIQARTDSGSSWANRWQLVWAGAGGAYFIHNLASDLCLDVTNGGRLL